MREVLLCCSNYVYFTCECEGHRIERIQKYSVSYVKKLTARVCFSQSRFGVLLEKNSPNGVKTY